MGHFTALVQDLIADSVQDFCESPPYVLKSKQKHDSALLKAAKTIDYLNEQASAALQEGNKEEAEELTTQAVYIHAEITGEIPERITKTRFLYRMFKINCSLYWLRLRRSTRQESFSAGIQQVPQLQFLQRCKIRTRAPRHTNAQGVGRSPSGSSDPDPDPGRPYIALGIDHKATTPAGPPLPVSLRLFPYRIEMRHCHENQYRYS